MLSACAAAHRGRPSSKRIGWVYDADAAMLCLQDRGALQVAKQRLFDRYYEGKIRALVDDAEQFNGVSRVCDAVDYMLSGKAIGKVVVRMHSSTS